MPYELSFLDELVTNNLQPKKDIAEMLTDEQLDTYFELIDRERYVVLNSFRNRIFQFRNKKQRQFYIQQHQLSIIRLKNKLVSRTDEFEHIYKEDNNGFNEMKLVNRLVDVLQIILDFLKDEFPFYFDEHAPVPVSYLKRVRERLDKQWKKVKTSLIKFPVEKELREMLTDSLYPVLNGEEYHLVSFKMIDYIKQVFTEIVCLKENAVNTACFHSPLIDLLIRMNFNCEPFVQWMIQYFRNTAELTVTNEERIAFFLRKSKELNQLTGTRDVGFWTNRRTVTEEIDRWLQTEILFFERSMAFTVKKPVVNNVDEADAEKGIYLTWTVEELGLYMHLLKENGQLMNKNMRELAKGMAGIYHTSRKEHLSWQNLYNCFSKAEMNTVRSLDSKLMDVINGLRKMKRGW